MKPIHVIKKMPSGRVQVLLAVSIVIVGVLIALVFIKLKKAPQRKEQEILTPLVKVERLERRDIQMVIRGYGTVSPRVQVEIVPQVSGKVVWVNPQFKAGGFIQIGGQILKIDPRDYELAVRQADAAVAEAQVKLDLERAEAKVAIEEWQQLNPDEEPTSPLVAAAPWSTLGSRAASRRDAHCGTGVGTRVFSAGRNRVACAQRASLAALSRPSANTQFLPHITSGPYRQRKQWRLSFLFDGTLRQVGPFDDDEDRRRATTRRTAGIMARPPNHNLCRPPSPLLRGEQRYNS